jgi:hypothetical protein
MVMMFLGGATRSVAGLLYQGRRSLEIGLAGFKQR